MGPQIKRTYVINKKSIFIVLALFSASANAHEQTYVLGLGLGVGNYGESKVTKGNYHAFLGYQYSPNWGGEFNYLVEGSELNLKSYTLSAKRKFQLSESNEVYLKIGGVYYDYRMHNKYTGIGLSASAGWQLKLYKNLGLYTEYSYSDLGEFDTTALNIGFTYLF